MACAGGGNGSNSVTQSSMWQAMAEKDVSRSESQDDNESTSAGSSSEGDVTSISTGDICTIISDVEQDEILVWSGNETSSCISGN